MRNEFGSLIDIVIPASSNSSTPSKKERRYLSQLTPYRLEIMILRNEMNISYANISLWLKIKKNIISHPHTISRRLKHWNNLRGSNETKQT